MDNQYYRYCFSCEKWKTKSEINEVDWGEQPGRESGKSYNCNVCRKDLGNQIIIFHCHHHSDIIMKVWGTLESENKEKIFYTECPEEKKEESQLPNKIDWKKVSLIGSTIVGTLILIWACFHWTNKYFDKK